MSLLHEDDDTTTPVVCCWKHLGISEAADNILTSCWNKNLMEKVWPPCSAGLSHHPDEYATPEHMEAGVRTLALALARLAGTAESGGSDRTEL